MGLLGSFPSLELRGVGGDRRECLGCHVMVLLGVVTGDVWCCVCVAWHCFSVHGGIVIKLYFISIDLYYRKRINIISLMATHSLC